MVGLCVRGPRRAHRRRGRVGFEALEARRMMAAAPAPAGPEFRVNTHTAGSQELFSEAPQAVAADADGDFVVAWSSSGQDGNAWGVYAQRFSADGAPRGGEFRVNQQTAASQWYPAVACAPGGSVVVAWTSELQDGSGDGVYARRFDADGAAVGDEFRVNTTTTDHQRHPTVAVDDSGDFAVAWSNFGHPDGAGWDVFAQRFTAAGARVGSEFRVNQTAAGNQQYAAVAADADGDLVFTWTADAQDGSGTGVYFRRFNAGTVQGSSEQRANTFTAGNQHYSRVAAAPEGDFVIAWASANQDGAGRGVYAQRYAASGAKRGSEFQVNQVSTGEQFAPTLACDAAGNFLVTWTGANDGNLFGVFARAYDASGASRGGEFRVNTHLPGNQVYSAAAGVPDGRFVVVWQSDGQDGSQFGVYGQRYAAPDTTPPLADVVDVSPDPRASPVDAVTVRFSEPVTGFDLADLRLTRDGLPLDLLTSGQRLTTTDNMTFTLSNLAPLTALPGAYSLALPAAGSGVADVAGNLLATDASDSWTLAAARVVARRVFYNGSSFDGFDSSAGPADDEAIATDKQALLPGGAAGFAHYTSSPRGLNGVMIDVAGWGASAPSLTAADFACRMGTAPDVAQWAAAPPMSLSVRRGAGSEGSDRVTLVWPDGAIVRSWLQITLLATAATRLAAPDVFYFGNLPGETGDDPAAAAVDELDFLRTRAEAHGSATGAVASDNPFDHDRNGRVDVRDVAVTRFAIAHDPLPLISPAAAARALTSASSSHPRRDYRPPEREVLFAEQAVGEL